MSIKEEVDQSEQIKELFKEIRINKAFKNAFFKKLAETDNPFPWLVELDESGFLYPYNKENFFDALNFLENCAKKLTKETEKDIIEKILDQIDKYISNPVMEDPIKNQYWINWMILKIIFLLPFDNIQDRHLDFIEYSLENSENTALISGELHENIVPKILSEKNTDMMLKVISIILKYEIISDHGFDEIKSIVDDYWFSQILIENRSDIIKICGVDIINIVTNYIDKILKEKSNGFNIAIIPAIEDSNQTMIPEKYECQIVYLLRDSLLHLDIENIEEILISFLKEKYSIYRRIAFYLINIKYDEFSNLFWELDYNPIEDYSHEHEVYSLLKDNCTKFTEANITKIITWIESIPDLYSKLFSEDKQRAENALILEKRKWLLSCQKANNEIINALYEKYTEQNSVEIKHPGWPMWNSGVVSVGPPPGTTFDFSKKENNEVVSYLNELDTSKVFIWDYNENVSGFKTEAKSNFDRYLSDPTTFSNMKIEYQRALFSALYDITKNNEFDHFEDFLTYTYGLIDTGFFITYEKDELLNSIVTYSSDIIEHVLRNSNFIITNDILVLIENILLYLIEHTGSDLWKIDDEIDAVLNSTLGSLYSSIIIYSLKYAEKHKEDDEKWPKSVKTLFTSLLNETPRKTEYLVTLGKCLPNLYYLDRPWVEEHFDEIFNDADDQWLSVFSSYLFYTRMLHTEIYNELNNKKLYIKALNEDIKKNSIKNKIIHHACISYLNKFEENAPGGLLNQILSTEDSDHLSTIILFVWRSRESIDENMMPRVVSLWGYLYDILLKHSDDETYRYTIAHLSYWLVLVEEINEDVLKWALFSTEKIRIGDESFVIEYLLNHVEKTPHMVGEIYANMIKNGVIPRYKKENVIALVEQLFIHGETEFAQDICEWYLQSGHHFLRSIHEKYS